MPGAHQYAGGCLCISATHTESMKSTEGTVEILTQLHNTTRMLHSLLPITGAKSCPVNLALPHSLPQTRSYLCEMPVTRPGKKKSPFQPGCTFLIFYANLSFTHGFSRCHTESMTLSKNALLFLRDPASS